MKKYCIILAAVMICCFFQSNQYAATTKYPGWETVQFLLADTVIRDIPVNKQGKSLIYERTKAAAESTGGLDVLDNGYDSLQIRIWYGYAFKNVSQILVIKYANEKWSGQLINNSWTSHEGDSLPPLKKNIQSIIPKSGWEILIKKLYKLQINSLPDYLAIENYPQYMDSDMLVVELATSNYYRLFSYPSPKLAKEEIKEAEMVTRIEELLVSEFGFQQIRKI